MKHDVTGKRRRYRFDDVRRSLDEHWGLKLTRGSRDGQHDGRWDVSYSRTGYIASGNIPGRGYRHIRFRSLTEIVKCCDLSKLLQKAVTRHARAKEEEMSTHSGSSKPSMTLCDSCEEEVSDDDEHWTKTKERPDGFWSCHSDVGKCRCAVCEHVWKPHQFAIPEKCPACGDRTDLFWADDGGWPPLATKQANYGVDW